MKKTLKWLLVLALCLLFSGAALADGEFDCSCTDIHVHVLPKSGDYGCFTPVCGKNHTHDYTQYTCFDRDNPSCGKASKLHELGCLSDTYLKDLKKYNYSKKLPAKIPAVKNLPYIYASMVTYQASNHR